MCTEISNEIAPMNIAAALSKFGTAAQFGLNRVHRDVISSNDDDDVTDVNENENDRLDEGHRVPAVRIRNRDHEEDGSESNEESTDVAREGDGVDVAAENTWGGGERRAESGDEAV